MKVTAEKLDNHKMTLEIEVPQAEVAKAIEQACRQLANQVSIPGFRKGKVPRKILEQRIGKEAILNEAFELMAGKAYGQALDEQELDPVTRPEVEVVTLAEDQPLVFKATVTVKPEVTLGEYKNLKVEAPSAEVSDEDVEKQLQSMRERQAKMVVAEGAELANGDFAIIDFKGFVAGEAFEGGEGKAYPLEIGSGSFIPGFEEQLVGAKAGEERKVNVTFPEEYHAEALAGKEAVFEVTVQDIKRKELPALDDEFAKDASVFATLDELRADVRNKLEQTAATRAETEFRTNAIKLAVSNATVDLPEVMVEQRIDNMINDLDINLQSRGMRLEQYLAFSKMDMTALKEQYREPAVEAVKGDMVLEAIVKAENLEAAPEDLEAEMVTMAAAYGSKVKDVAKIIQKQGYTGAFLQSILRKKATQLILDTVEKA